MKIAKLPNGAELRFPEDTSDDVIKDTVKRVLGVREGPVLEDVIDQFGSALTEREKVDFYGPAIKEQTKATRDSTKSIVSAIKKLSEKKQTDAYGPAMQKHGGIIDKVAMTVAGIFVKNSQEDRKSAKESAKELTRQVVVLSNNVEVLTSHITKNAIMLSKSQDQNTTAVRELVAAYKAPRKVVRDADGKISKID